MKSTKVQNPRHILHITAIMCARILGMAHSVAIAIPRRSAINAIIHGIAALARLDLLLVPPEPTKASTTC